MWGFDFGGTATDDTLSGVLVFAIVSVFICLYLANKCFELKQKNKRLNHALGDPIKHIKHYFDEQFVATKDINSRALPDASGPLLSKEVVALRSAYLKIERKALDQAVQADKFWPFLNDHLLRLIKIVMPNAFSREAEVRQMEEKIALMKERIKKLPLRADDDSAVQRQERALSSLDDFARRYRSAFDDQRRFAVYVDKVDGVVAAFEQPQERRQQLAEQRRQAFRDRSNGHLRTLEDSGQRNGAHLDAIDGRAAGDQADPELQIQLAKFRAENARLNQYIAELKTELRIFGRDLISGAVEPTPEKEVKRPELRAEDLSEELLEANEKEIDRLRGVINNQRRALVGMEENLKVMESISSGRRDTSHQQDIDMLRRNIAESEICIRMLETELDALKTDLAELRQAAPAASISGAEVDGLLQELETIKGQLGEAMDRSGQQERLLGFVEEALTASSVEDLSLLIFDSVSALHWEPNLVIATPERAIELAKAAGLPAREKVAISNMQINEINPGEGGQLMLRFIYLSGLIKPLSDTAATESDQRAVVQLLKVADRLVHQLIQMQKSKKTHETLETCSNDIKQTAFDVDKLLEAQAVRVKLLVANSMGEIQDLARAKGLNASHVAAYEAVAQEALKQLEADGSIRLKLRKKFLALVDDIEARS